MRVLVTGGAGFIGSHLCEYLLDRGHSVVSVDNFATGSRDNVNRYRGRAGFSFFEGDCTERGVLKLLVRECDAAVHLAAAVGVQKTFDEPLWTLETNIDATHAILKTCKDFNTRLLIASTSEVYGRSSQQVFGENDDLLIGPPTSPRWGYAASKLVDEFFALAYHAEFKLPVTIIRFFNTVGPRQTGRYGMVIPRLIRQAIGNEDLTIFGDGEQRRTFTAVNQAVQAVVELIDCPASIGTVLNLGGNAEVSINQLADIIIRMTNSKSRKRYIEYADFYGAHFEDMRRRNPDTRKLHQTLGWAPQSTIEEILAPIIEDIRARVGAGEQT